jgi:hypothetical protein
MCKPPSTNALQALPNPGNDLRAFYHFISIVLWRRIAATTLLAVCLVLSSLLAADRPLESAAFTVEDFADVLLPISDFFVIAIVFTPKVFLNSLLRHILMQPACQTQAIPGGNSKRLKQFHLF